MEHITLILLSISGFLNLVVHFIWMKKFQLHDKHLDLQLRENEIIWKELSKKEDGYFVD